MNVKNYAIILAGGKGERFWPMSTSRQPKQLLALVGKKSLLALAAERLNGLVEPSRIFVITNKDLVPACRKAARGLPAANIIGEPFGRDTAAAIALGAALIKNRDPNAVFCVVTADHIIADEKRFRRTLAEALKLAAKQDVLITVGITPTKPSTGYGYIEAGQALKKAGDVPFMKVKRFVEKPDEKTAARYLASGRFYWNSGMFIWSLRSFESALRRYRPQLAGLIERLSPVARAKTFQAKLADEYGKLEKISIDYALMERARNIVVARGSFKWDDVGSWPALENHLARNNDGNVVIGLCESLDSADNVVVSPKHLTALIGVRDLIVVNANHATIVCAKGRAQDVKKMVEKLKMAGRYSEVL